MPRCRRQQPLEGALQMGLIRETTVLGDVCNGSTQAQLLASMTHPQVDQSGVGCQAVMPTKGGDQTGGTALGSLA